MKILVVGGDSYVAQRFMRYQRNSFQWAVVSRKATQFEGETLSHDFWDLKDDVFRRADVVYNCAAIVHQPEIQDKSLYDKVNRRLAVHLAEQAQKNGVKKFVQMSTIAVFGNQNEISETTPEKPVTPYGESKLAADHDLLAMQNENFSVLVVRPPMIYGAEAPGNMQKLIGLVAKKMPLPFRNANAKRDFIYIENFAHLLAAAIKKDLKGIVYFSDNKAISTSELVEEIAKGLGQKSRIFALPGFLAKAGKKIKPEIFEKLFGSLHIETSTTLEKLGTKPPFSVWQGIAKTVEWYKNKAQ